MALEWITAQLLRPIDKHVWQRGEEAVAEKWLLADTGRELGALGARRSRRRPPGQVLHLRTRD
jgi:hypothetical protein